MNKGASVKEQVKKEGRGWGRDFIRPPVCRALIERHVQDLSRIKALDVLHSSLCASL